jgi:hypothetical protein
LALSDVKLTKLTHQVAVAFNGLLHQIIAALSTPERRCIGGPE